jgi:hypothetical protein
VPSHFRSIAEGIYIYIYIYEETQLFDHLVKGSNINPSLPGKNKKTGYVYLCFSDGKKKIGVAIYVNVVVSSFQIS